MHFTLKTAAIIGLACVSISSQAGQFRCAGYGDTGCTDHITSIVTDKFTAKFPASKYKIVMVYDFQTYSDGGGVGFAVAGVSPIVSETNKYGVLSLMPKNRFTSTVRIDKTKTLNPYQVTQEKIDLMQRAATLLMEACDRDANCDVMDLK